MQILKPMKIYFFHYTGMQHILNLRSLLKRRNGSHHIRGKLSVWSNKQINSEVGNFVWPENVINIKIVFDRKRFPPSMNKVMNFYDFAKKSLGKVIKFSKFLYVALMPCPSPGTFPVWKWPRQNLPPNIQSKHYHC